MTGAGASCDPPRKSSFLLCQEIRGFYVGDAQLGGVRIFDARVTNVKTLIGLQRDWYLTQHGNAQLWVSN